MGSSEMPEKFKPSHAINDSFRPRTTCVHFEKGKKKSSQCISCHKVIYSVNVQHHLKIRSHFECTAVKLMTNSLMEVTMFKNIMSLNRKSSTF